MTPDSPHMPPNSTARLHTLDLLRGVAMLGVIIDHSAQGIPSGIGVLDRLLLSCGNGVQLFFLISAFSVWTMWERRAGEPRPAASFYLRRFFRIAPLFWLAIPVYVALHGFGPRYSAPEGLGWRQILQAATFLHGFWPDAMNSVVPGGWSIAVEMTFYVFFPLLAWRMGRRKTAYLLLAIGFWLAYALWIRAGIAGVLARHYHGTPELVDDFLSLNFAQQIPIFLLGCYLYHALKSGTRAVELLVLALWLGVAALLKFVWAVDGIGYLCIFMALGAFFYAGMRWQLRSTLLERLGQHSYAIYLTHFLVLEALGAIVPAKAGVGVLLVVIVLLTGCSYVLARVLHIAVERPVQRGVDRLVRRVQRASPPVARPLVEPGAR